MQIDPTGSFCNRWSLRNGFICSPTAPSQPTRLNGWEFLLSRKTPPLCWLGLIRQLTTTSWPHIDKCFPYQGLSPELQSAGLLKNSRFYQLLVQLRPSPGSFGEFVSCQAKRAALERPPPLYSGIIRHLAFDPARWRWSDGHQLSEYTSNIGRALLTQHKQLRRPIPAKWPGHLPVNFSPDWREVWHKRRPCKEAAFMWSIWHNAVAVHTWRARITPGIDTSCSCCNLGVEESPAHRFYFCPQAQDIWTYAQSILLHLLNDAPRSTPHNRFDFQQCVFGTQLPSRYHAVRTIWSSLRGSVLWIMWISRNSKVFSQSNWALDFAHQTVWSSLLDSGRAAQLRTQIGARLNPDRAALIWQKFDNAWLLSPTLAYRIDNRIIWTKQGPPCLSFM